MTWWDWADPSFTLALLGAGAGVGAAVLAIVIPLQIHRAAAKGQRIAQDMQMQLLQMQRWQLTSLRRARWEHLVEALPSIDVPVVFNVMLGEFENYHGVELEYLESAARANPLQPLPLRVRSADEAIDYIKSFPARSLHRGSMFRDEAKRFASECSEALGEDDLSRIALATGLVTCFPAARTPGHQFYRELVSDGSWRFADDLLNAARHLPRGGHAANVITGVLLATKDIHMGSQVKRGDGGAQPLWFDVGALKPRHGWPRNELDRAMFNARMKAAIASLLMNDLTHWGQWPDEGLSDSSSAAVAWIVRASGEVAVGDEHLEMRIMQYLPSMVRSLPARERQWGMDLADVQHGLSLLQRNCPSLWAKYGPGLVQCTGVSTSPNP